MTNNKPLILAASVVLALIVIGFSVYGLFTPGHRVKAILPEGVDSITIDGHERKNGQSFGINAGEYTYQLNGDNIDSSEREISISSDDNELVISYAPYSPEHLSQLLEEHNSRIRSEVSSQYIDNVDGYSIQKVQLLDRGQYAVVLIAPNHVDPIDPVNVYRLVLQQSGGSWRDAAGPELLLTTANSPDVDKYILQTANNLDL